MAAGRAAGAGKGEDARVARRAEDCVEAGEGYFRGAGEADDARFFRGRRGLGEVGGGGEVCEFAEVDHGDD